MSNQKRLHLEEKIGKALDFVKATCCFLLARATLYCSTLLLLGARCGRSCCCDLPLLSLWFAAWPPSPSWCTRRWLTRVQLLVLDDPTLKYLNQAIPRGLTNLNNPAGVQRSYLKCSVAFFLQMIVTGVARCCDLTYDHL